MTTMTINFVADETRRWEGPKGVIEFISVDFTDGSRGSIGCKPENVDQRLAELRNLIDKPGEYDLEAKPEYQGTTQWRIVGFPGRPKYNGNGSAGMSDEDRATLARIETKLDSLARIVMSVGVGSGEGAEPASADVEGGGMVSGESPEQATQAPHETPPRSASFDELAKAAGGRAKARSLINDTAGTTYSAASVLDATPSEIAAAFEALEGLAS